jgi:hypothetical protein
MVVVGGEGIQWQHLFGILLISHLVIRILLGNKIPVAPASPWMLAFIVATLISCFAFINEPGEHVTEFWKSEVQYIFGVLLFFAVSHAKLRSDDLLRMLKAMIVISVFVALFGIYQLPARYFEWPGGFITLNNPSLSGSMQIQAFLKDITRAASIFSEPSYFGRYLVGSLALSLPVALHRPRLFGNPLLLWLMIAIQAAGLVLSSSMGAWYIMGEVAIVMLFIEKGLARMKLLSWFAMVIGFGLCAMLAIEAVSGYPILQTIIDRATGIYYFFQGDQSQLIAGESLIQRIETSKIAFAVWLDHPIIGVGVGSYSLVSFRYGEWNTYGFAANSLVNTLAENGIIGFLILLCMAFSSLIGLWRVFRFNPDGADNDPDLNELNTLGFVARLAFYLMVTEVLYFHLAGFLFRPEVWFYFGLAGLVPNLARRVRMRLRARSV